MINPISDFREWFEEEYKLSNVSIPTAVCLSTNGLDGFPNARIVSLKEIVNNNFIVTGPLNSRKGLEIDNNSKVALTFWWTETESQVRIQGIASKIANEDADIYFSKRDIISQAVSTISNQGEVMHNLPHLENQIQEKILGRGIISRPSDWGGFSIKPIRIEFMRFKETRFHERKLYKLKNGKWIIKQIQP